MPDAQPPARSIRALLVDGRFGPFFFGKLASAAGVWVQNIAAAILVFDLTGSAAAVGLVSVLQFAPQMVLALWMGALTDRVDRRRLLLTGRTVSTSASAGLGLFLWWTGTDGLTSPTPIYFATLLLGLGLAISAPAMQALVPALVSRADLPSAVVLNSTTGNLARAVGPALGAAIYAVGGPAPPFLVAAGGNLAFILALLLIRPTAQARRAGDRSIRAGLRYLRQDRPMRLRLLSLAGLTFAVDPVITLTAPLAAHLGRGETFVGVLASAFGAGAVLAVLLHGRLRLAKRVPVPMIGFGSLVVGMLVVAATPGGGGTLAAMALAGFGFLLATSGLTTEIQQWVPEEFRGRVMALWGVAFLGSRPIAATANGVVADAFGVGLAFAVAASVVLAAGWVGARR